MREWPVQHDDVPLTPSFLLRTMKGMTCLKGMSCYGAISTWNGGREVTYFLILPRLFVFPSPTNLTFPRYFVWCSLLLVNHLISLTWPDTSTHIFKPEERWEAGTDVTPTLYHSWKINMSMSCALSHTLGRRAPLSFFMQRLVTRHTSFRWHIAIVVGRPWATLARGHVPKDF